MYIITYKASYVHIFCSVFIMGLLAFGTVALALVWVRVTHHANL